MYCLHGAWRGCHRERINWEQGVGGCSPTGARASSTGSLAFCRSRLSIRPPPHFKKRGSSCQRWLEDDLGKTAARKTLDRGHAHSCSGGRRAACRPFLSLWGPGDRVCQALPQRAWETDTEKKAKGDWAWGGGLPCPTVGDGTGRDWMFSWAAHSRSAAAPGPFARPQSSPFLQNTQTLLLAPAERSG